MMSVELDLTPHSGPTLDALFRSAAARRPEALALCDPPNRPAFTDHAPRTLTYAEADRAVSAITARLREAGLPSDSVVGIQLPNIAENTLSILGVLRAGMIPALIPLLWRKADCVAALSGISPKALIVCARVGDFDHALLAADVAAEIFSVRHVFAFGRELPDGLASLDEVFGIADGVSHHDEPVPGDNPGGRIAAVTFDVTSAGTIAVGRTHHEVVASALGPVVEADLADDATLLSPYGPSSLAGLALATVPWLLSGGTLVLHQPFDPEVLSAQIAERKFDLLVVPGSVASRLADSGILPGQNRPKAILLAWRTPERVAGGASPKLLGIPLVDVRIFGETGLVAARRQLESRPAPLPVGAIRSHMAGADSPDFGEIVRTQSGTVAMRGPMVPHAAFPPGAERIRRNLPGDTDAVDTGYPCRIERDILVITGPPPGIVSLGGYRFALKDLQDRLGRIERGCTLAALPNAIVGYRLAGESADRATLRRSLTELGANPLIVRAFRGRGEKTPAA
jgi:hypothetical protein